MKFEKNSFPVGTPKDDVFQCVRELAVINGLKIDDVRSDLKRPWGGFFVIDNECAPEFLNTFFPDLDIIPSDVQPKLLIISPTARLSWQYHHRRAEAWCALTPVGYFRSETDIQPKVGNVLESEDICTMKVSERHRLLGLEHNWGIVAECWIHQDPDNLSTEDDIVKLKDDYGRVNA